MAAYNSQTQYTRRLDDFRGVDLTSGQVQVSPKRFAYAQNMWRDYSAELGGAIETVPGFRALCKRFGVIHGIWPFRPFEGELYVMVHAGTSLYQFKHADRDSIADDPELMTEYTGLADAKSTAFVFNGRFYILDGESFRVLIKTDDGFELSSTEDTAYLPVTFINGEMYEQRNMLIDRTINRETQAPEYNAAMLYKYGYVGAQESVNFGEITGFAEDHSADAIIIVKNIDKVEDADGRILDEIYRIDNGAFEGDEQIRRVKILREVVSGQINNSFVVGVDAFRGANKLESVELCNTGASPGAFAECEALEYVYLNGGVAGAGAFRGCGNLKVIKLVGAPEINDSAFEDCKPTEIWLDTTTKITLPSKVANTGTEDISEDFLIFWFPYIEAQNPDYDADKPVTIDNFPYLLEKNESYDSNTPPYEYEIVKNNFSPEDPHLVGYTILMNLTRKVTNEDTGEVEDKTIDWSQAEEYNNLPFVIEAFEYGGDQRYRAVPNYKTASTFGDISGVEKVYTAYSAAEIADKGYTDLEAFLDAVKGAEIHFTSPTPVGLGLIPIGQENYTSTNTIAHDVVVYDPADSVHEVLIDDKTTDEYGVIYVNIDGERHVERVVLTDLITDDDELTEHDIDVVLNCKPGKFATAEGYLDFMAGNKDYEGTSRDAIVKSRISATFDGRIFLTGNPALPNTVFYCQRDNTGYPNPAYWGVLNYVNDGVGQSPNVAMLSTAGMLMVLKGNDPHDATVYYHTGVDSGNDVIPRIYPSERGLSGVGCNGIAVNFRDDAVFMSKDGLEAVGKEQVNLERTLTHRSSLVDRMMTRERLFESVAAEWNGYLMIFTPSGNVYMADSRQMHRNGENVEYEWYLLSDVGVYEGQTEDYEQITGDVMLYDEETGLRWLSEEHTEAYAVVDGVRYPIELPPNEPQFIESGAVWDSHVYKHASGSDVWLDEEGAELRADVALFEGKVYIVAPSGRYSGGEFRCVTSASDIDGVLYFGTQDGTVCCFNTDKRDVPYGDEPPADGTIHRHWYTFNGRQIDSFLTTAYDHAGYPDLAKKTVKKSLVVHSKTFPGARMEVRVRTNRNDEWRQVGIISVATYDFYSLDFASAPLQIADEILTTIREKEKKWALKQLYFGSVGFMNPWGIYSAGYRFTVTGRIKS